METIIKRLSNLLSVKSLVTLCADRCVRFYGLHQSDQPGLHDHLCRYHCVLFWHSEPEDAGAFG